MAPRSLFLACAVSVAAGTSERGREIAANYDEGIAAQYVWMAQITGMDPGKIQTWTCGLACDTVKDVNNVRVTQNAMPLQTLGVVAKWGSDECIVSFRGSKTFLNYLLDDGDFVWTSPWASCTNCKVHKGFYDSWSSLRDQTYKDLSDLGCTGKPIRVTGHSLGAAMAAIASFELADTYALKHVYTYGQPRVGNLEWVNAFQSKMANVPYFRIVEFMDPVPHLPPQGFIMENSVDIAGYQHPGPEVHYTATKMGQYNICVTGEDPNCSDKYSLPMCLPHGCDHCSYMGLNPCDWNTANPQCNEGPPSPSPPSPPGPATCDASWGSCPFGNPADTCRGHLNYAMTSQKKACQDALAEVHSQCGACSGCSQSDCVGLGIMV